MNAETIPNMTDPTMLPLAEQAAMVKTFLEEVIPAAGTVYPIEHTDDGKVAVDITTDIIIRRHTYDDAGNETNVERIGLEYLQERIDALLDAAAGGLSR